MRRNVLAVFGMVFLLIGLAMPTVFAFAQETEVLNKEIQKKQDQVKEIDGLIHTYKAKIDERRLEAQSLENQIALLENRVTEKTLAVERTQIEIEALTLEVELMTKEIEIKESKISKQKLLIEQLIRDIHQRDDVTVLDVFLSNGTISEMFSELEEVKRVERDLSQTLARMKDTKSELEQRKTSKETKQADVENERRSLRKEMLALEAEKNFKASLITQTKESESEFQRILYELRQQQQSASSVITELEERLREQLQSVDEALARGDSFLTWPMDPSRGITAIFHDPGYPFRHLFEHPGVDIRAPQGTTVKTSGGGYVAWNKTGRMYGNYTMIVHTGGLATVYAHLSKFLAKPDTFVERGDPIALSGGAAGTPGAGLSTGPHLHFEVRKDGIPVDPEKFLPQVPNNYYDYYDDYKRWKLRL